MRIEKRWNAKRNRYWYSLVYYDATTGRRIRISQREILRRHGKRLTVLSDAKKIATELSGEIDTATRRRMRRREWRKKFKHQRKLIRLFENHLKIRKLTASTISAKICYLEFYVFHYFLEVKRCEYFSEWSKHYDSFKSWLEHDARRVSNPDRFLSYQTKDHCIQVLNSFMGYLERNGMIDYAYECEAFGKRFHTKRGAEIVLSHVEFQFIRNQLHERDPLSATFYHFLYESGCRFNEVMGISLRNMSEGEVPSGTMRELLQRYDIKYFGFIFVNSQPELREIRDPKTQTVPRRPLKSRGGIDYKSTRVIPILSKRLWDELLVLYKGQMLLYGQRIFGENPENYLLFDRVKSNSVRALLRSVYRGSSFSYKPFHALRHTRSTELVGTYNDYLLARLWVGHRNVQTHERYNHVHEQVGREVSNNHFEQKIRNQINVENEKAFKESGAPFGTDFLRLISRPFRKS